MAPAIFGNLQDPRIRLYCGPRAGATAARNRLLELTTTDVCALMDADDVAAPDRLHMQWNVMREHPELVLLGTQIQFMAGGRTFASARFPTQHAAIVRALKQATPVLCHPACMFRTDAAIRAGRYRLPYGEEFDLFLRLSEEGKVANLPDKLLKYRIHLGSTFATKYPEYKAHIAYAIFCYRCRLAGEGEMPLTEFLKRWDNCSWGQRMWRRLDAWSARRSRQALIEIGGGRRLKGSIQLAVAAACRPGSARDKCLPACHASLRGRPSGCQTTEKALP